MITRFHSKILDLPCKFDSEAGIVTVKELNQIDKSKYVEYSAKELEILEHKELDPYIFTIKTMFGGIVDDKPKLADLKMKGIM